MIDTLELITIPPEDEALRAEVRDFLAETLDGLEPDKRARSWMGFDAAFSRKLAERGWLGLTLPREHGGSARGHFARFVLSEELLGAGAPVSAHWIADRQSAPLILKYGTPAQQAFYLPRICRAEAFFCSWASIVLGSEVLARLMICESNCACTCAKPGVDTCGIA